MSRALKSTALAAALWLTMAAGASAYAPASTATIRPGVMTLTDGAQCTANFVFSDGATTYLGQAAHCSGTGAATETDGCKAKSLPLGTPVTIVGSGVKGTLAYNSWRTMQALGEKNPDTCAYNDLALIAINPVDVSKVNPSIPVFGGPNGVNTSGAPLGATVFSYGNSSLRQGIQQLSPKVGKSVGDDGNGWSHTVYTVTPGIPGDSGSAFLDRSGRALGVLSTVALLPLPASNGVGDLGRELNYLKTRGGMPGAVLVKGTEPFNPGLFGLLG